MTKFIAVVSGKGGVGKTTSTLNIGQALTDLGKNTVVVDANLATPNLAIKLGFINPKGTLNKFLRKEKSVSEILYLHESGLSVIPSSPSYSEFQNTDPQKVHKIFQHLDNSTEFVLIDSPSGLGQDIHHILKHSDEVLIVANPNMSSVIDALKTIQLSKANHNIVAGIILNRTNKGKHEMSSSEISKILNCQILAEIKECKKIRKSVHKSMPLNYIYPRSKSAKQFTKVAKHLTHEYER